MFTSGWVIDDCHIVTTIILSTFRSQGRAGTIISVLSPDFLSIMCLYSSKYKKIIVGFPLFFSRLFSEVKRIYKLKLTGIWIRNPRNLRLTKNLLRALLQIFDFLFDKLLCIIVVSFIRSKIICKIRPRIHWSIRFMNHRRGRALSYISSTYFLF